MTLDLNGPLEQLIAAARRGLKAAADDVLDRSNNLVPQESGDLKESGKVTGDGDKQSISYGRGISATYAVPQHERTELRHTGGQAKFLETALLGGQDISLGIIADEMRKVTG